MKVMILSDSHSMTKNNLYQLITHHQCDYILHCGDIYAPYSPLEIDHFYNVRGNNDYSDIPKQLTLIIDGKKFFMCHGHGFNIDYGESELIDYARSNHVDVVCFGHTHNPTLKTVDDILFINPGSVTYPRGNYRFPTYCLLDTHTLEVQFYNAKTHELCNPFVQEKKEKKSFFSFFKK